MLKSPSSFNGHSTVIIPIKPMFCIDITSIPNEAVVAKRTVAFAVTYQKPRRMAFNNVPEIWRVLYLSSMNMI